MVRHAITAVLGLCIPCRHRRQTITGRKLTTGVHEMFLVCTRCGKRVSPGVLVGPDADRIAVNPTGSGGELVTANSLAK